MVVIILLIISPEGYVDMFEWGAFKGLSEKDAVSFIKGYINFQRNQTETKLRERNASEEEIQTALDTAVFMEYSSVGSKRLVLFQQINECFSFYISVKKEKKT